MTGRYDFSIAVGPEPIYIEPFFTDQHPALTEAGNVPCADGGYSRCGNYTSNVTPIWSRCLQAGLSYLDAESVLTASVGVNRAEFGLRHLDGARCGEIAPLLAAAVEWGVEHIDELRELNPPNGWGDADGAVTYLWDMQRFCEANHPKARITVSE